MKVDLASLTLLDQQVLQGFGSDALNETRTASIVAAPENNSLLATTVLQNGPGPVTSGASLYDVSISAHGDLSLSSSEDDSTPGVSKFSLIANYLGNKAITGATLMFTRRTSTNATALSCATQLASNCVIETSPGDFVYVTFDMQPSGRVEVSGAFNAVSNQSAASMTAALFGPVGLTETTTANNFVRFILPDRIFKEGFD